MQMRQELKYRSQFGDNGIDDDFDEESDWDEDRLSEDESFDPDHLSRREVNVRLRQYTRGDRDWLFSY